MTKTEKKLWFLYLRHLPIMVHRQKVIQNFIVDFYIAQAKLVIEVDGDSHFSPEALAYDEERTNILESFGLRVLRFTNKEVMENFESVCEVIKRSTP